MEWNIVVTIYVDARFAAVVLISVFLCLHVRLRRGRQRDPAPNNTIILIFFFSFKSAIEVYCKRYSDKKGV